MHRVYNKSLNTHNAEIHKYTMLDELHSYNTRTKHKRNYFITRVATKQAQKCLIYIGPKIWNQIPLQVKEIVESPTIIVLSFVKFHL